MRRLLTALWLAMVAQAVQAQEGWGNLDALLQSNLTNPGSVLASYWLPNAADPAVASIAFGVLYKSGVEATSSTYGEVGVFARQPGGWIYVGTVDGVFGQKPQNAVFGSGVAELTTVLPGPGEPRCCPTQLTRWRINLSTLQAERLQ